MVNGSSFDIAAWMKQPISVAPRYEPAQTMPRHERLCFLVAANDGFRFTGWGTITSGPDGHQRGLEQEDALHLLQISAFLSGVQACGVDWEAAFAPYWEAYKVRQGAPAAPAVESPDPETSAPPARRKAKQP